MHHLLLHYADAYPLERQACSVAERTAGKKPRQQRFECRWRILCKPCANGAAKFERS